MSLGTVKLHEKTVYVSPLNIKMNHDYDYCDLLWSFMYSRVLWTLQVDGQVTVSKVRSLPPNILLPVCLQFSPDGTTLVLGGYDGRVQNLTLGSGDVARVDWLSQHRSSDSDTSKSLVICDCCSAEWQYCITSGVYGDDDVQLCNLCV